MKRIMNIAFLLAGFAALCGCGPGPATTATQGHFALNVPYTSEGDPLRTLDLFIPRAERPVPLVVWIHGGGWTRGAKEGCPATMLIPEGFAVASLNYRLAPAARWPAQIEDCRAALAFLRKYGSGYGIDPRRIGVWGASAGGHLAALLGAGGEVQAVCDFFGPVDLVGAEGDLAVKVRDLLGPASPARASMPAELGDCPPFLIVHGDADQLVPLAQSRALHGRLRAADVDADLLVIPGARHGDMACWGPDVRERTRAFFRRHLH